MKVSNKYRKKDFSYLLHNNLSQQKNDCNQTPIFNQYNSEEREKAIYRLYFCQGGKMLSEPEKRERKKVFKKLGFTNDLLDKLFIEYKANLISSTKNQIYLYQNQDKWRIIRRNDLLYLYHNNYYVSGDGTRYIMPGFHIQVYSQ